jgi:hypothetical protein
VRHLALPDGSDVHFLRLSSTAALLERLRDAGHDRPLVALSQALAASPPAHTLRDVVLAVRERPEPILVFHGRVDEPGRARLGELAGLLDEAGTRLRLIDWPTVERQCLELAQRLVDRLGRGIVEDARFLATPRGGLIVGGLLAYALGVPRQRISAGRPHPSADEGLVIVVDDCVISGLRLRATLNATQAPSIAVASLYSHPELRTAVEREEPRVVACVAASNLHDHADRLLGEDAPAWRARWRARVPQRYHTGLMDLIVFPWSEPEVRLWNPVTNQVEANWWLAPPAVCLHHRARRAALPLQVADDQLGTVRLTPTVVPVSRPGRTVLVDAANGRSVTLRGTADELWQAWIRADDTETAAAGVARRYDVPNERVLADLDGLLGDLAARGMLAPGEATV